MNGHGTHSGLNWHHATGIPLCADCKTFKLLYMRARRFKRGEQHDPTRCVGCGSVFPGHTCHLDQGRR